MVKPSAIPPDKLLSLYTCLVKIRQVQLKIEAHYPQDEMKTPVHLCLGQEAVSAGVCAHLRKEDMVFSNHRSHGHYLAKGGDLKAMMAELYCKQTGCAQGRGGSMHLIDTSVGHYGSSAIVGGGIPHAVGAGLAFQMKKKDLVAVTFLGDAASEQGVFYESMNLAALKKLPVIFVCENNHYSVCSHIDVRQANFEVFKRARAFDIPSKRIDGMDVLEVYHTAQEAIEFARAGNGPFVLECVVQRWRAHAGAGDPLRKHYRKEKEWDEAVDRDPLKDFREYLLKNCLAEADQLDQIYARIDQEIEEAFRFAQESPLPDPADVGKFLFS